MLNEMLTQNFSTVSTNYGLQKPSMGTFDPKSTVAFAKLEGIGHQYYMSDPEIYIGRRNVENNFFDEPLEKTASASRHAKISYNFAIGRYELSVLQQVNVYLEGHLLAMGATVPLKDKDNIQIGNASWRFVLPKTPQNSNVTHEGATKSNLNLYEEINIPKTTSPTSTFTSISDAVAALHSNIPTKKPKMQIELLIKMHIFNPVRNPIPEYIVATLPQELAKLSQDAVCNILFSINNSLKMGNTAISPALLKAVGLLE